MDSDNIDISFIINAKDIHNVMWNQFLTLKINQLFQQLVEVATNSLLSLQIEANSQWHYTTQLSAERRVKLVTLEEQNRGEFYSVFVSPHLNPSNKLKDLNALLDVLNSTCNNYSYITYYDYNPGVSTTTGNDRYWPAIEEALARVRYETTMAVKILNYGHMTEDNHTLSYSSHQLISCLNSFIRHSSHRGEIQKDLVILLQTMPCIMVLATGLETISHTAGCPSVW
ncbi:hypothetical protein EB796_003241 [Bugula neritina]|uniref:Uncharacterized protein n=1 Tax=Bugula neritina TaxID=10212 RepID=A0A7J7KL60_BUGNE|nr:hypothetical protein EB796_003241 [Bugula neritina]